ncbi:hypothetical protein BDZ89DRAFT_813231 [Hymenopellis radicata]|nr:hypothetical protein BDZ89DRAFT_813231 [Hymenopellis radicata]
MRLSPHHDDGKRSRRLPNGLRHGRLHPHRVGLDPHLPAPARPPVGASTQLRADRKGAHWSTRKWGLRLSSSLRGVGWSNEPKVFRPRATWNSSHFVHRQESRVNGYVGGRCRYRHSVRYAVPSIHEGRCIVWERPWYWKPVDMLFWLTMVEGNAVLIHGAVSILSVALHLSRPEDWTHSFGYWSDAYTLRRFWGRVWHQFLRGFLSAHGKFMARQVLNLKAGTNASSYVQLYVAFVLSGIMHLVAEYTAGMGWTNSTSVTFFLIQATGIAFEDGVIAAVGRLGLKEARSVRTLGFLWVLVWFYMTLPPWWDPIHRLGLLACSTGHSSQGSGTS